MLASTSLVALVLTDSPRKLRLAVVGALWAFLLVSITGRFKAKADLAPSESDEELRRFYQMELQQEVAARREYELRLEVQMRRELEESRTQEIEELRSEVHRLRAELMGIEPPDRAALLAQATRMSPERVQTLHDDAQRVGAQQRRPGERLQLPAGFSDSPPPAEPAPAYASMPSYDADSSQPRLPVPGGMPSGPEPYQAGEYVPAASHGTGTHRHGGPTGPEPAFAPAGPDRGEVNEPASYGGLEEFTVVTPYGTPESSGTFGAPVPSPAWSSYASPPVPPASVATPAGPPPPVGPMPGGPPTYTAVPVDGYGSSPSHPPTPQAAGYPGYPSYPAAGPAGAAGAAGAAIEPYTGHPAAPAGSPDGMSRPDPFDPSNTWPGAFKVAHEERTPMAPSPRDANPYPQPTNQPVTWQPTGQAAEWHPAETPARGRHHAGDEPAESHPNGTPARAASRPEDDVLAQILGRW
ncbi:MAG TPA: DUF6779 domain-containing protein [Mycobacteriales bacterium]|nr:DUF6779 domain-containing protein [Mycobacteriales bacterium]